MMASLKLYDSPYKKATKEIIKERDLTLIVNKLNHFIQTKIFKRKPTNLLMYILYMLQCISECLMVNAAALFGGFIFFFSTRSNARLTLLCLAKAELYGFNELLLNCRLLNFY